MCFIFMEILQTIYFNLKFHENTKKQKWLYTCFAKSKFKVNAVGSLDGRKVGIQIIK